MRTNLLIICILISFTSSFSQVLEEGDKNISFISSPDNLGQFDATPVEEVVGSSASSFGPLGLRGRGNFFTCTTERRLVEHRMFLNPSAATTMWFCVYEGDAQVGTYTQKNTVERTAQGPGQGWYSSGPIDVTLVPGKYYIIYTQWDATANYYNQQAISPYPISVLFGQLTGAAGWATGSVPAYGAPPPATQTFTSAAFVDPVAYYQTIVTDDIIPVELTSFAAASAGEVVNLTWSTATETNNKGFEVQRKVNDDFSTVAFVDGNGTTTENQSYSYSEKVSVGTYTYRLKQVDYTGQYEYSDEVNVDVIAPLEFALAQNFPNPFNPATKITFSLKVDSEISLKVFNVLGQEVATVLNGNFAAGTTSIDFNANGLNSGVYVYKIEAKGIDGSSFTSAKKMILTK